MCTPRTTAKGLLHVSATRVSAYSKIAIKTDPPSVGLRSRIRSCLSATPTASRQRIKSWVLCSSPKAVVSGDAGERYPSGHLCQSPLCAASARWRQSALKQRALLNELAALAAEGLELLPGRPSGRALTRSLQTSLSTCSFRSQDLAYWHGTGSGRRLTRRGEAGIVQKSLRLGMPRAPGAR